MSVILFKLFVSLLIFMATLVYIACIERYNLDTLPNWKQLLYKMSPFISVVALIWIWLLH